MKYWNHAFLATVALMPAFGAQAAPKPYSLQDYLDEVAEKHEGVRAANDGMKGADERSAEGRLLYSPAFFAEAIRSTDARKNTNPAFIGSRTERGTYQLGVDTRLPIGATLRAAYDVWDQDTTGAQPAFLPVPKNSQASPSLSGTLSLWRNLFGGEIRAEKQALEASALSTSWAERAKRERILAEAELAYWRLSLARETARTSKEILTRTEEMVGWARRRANLHLSDESDLLQTEAAFELRKYELKIAEEEAESAERAFQSQVSEDPTGSKPAPVELERFPESFGASLPLRSTLGSTLKSAEYGMKASVAAHMAARERAKPTLELFGSYARQSLELERSDAIQNSFDPDHYQSAIGVRLRAPLDLFGLSRVQEGRALEAEASEAEYRRLRFDLDTLWNDLGKRWSSAKEKYSITTRLTELQRKKLTRERTRLSQGRSTTFQILQFQQDLLQAEISRIRSQLELASLYTQMKLFEGAAP